MLARWLGLALGALALAPASAFAAPGDLDTTFGAGTGIVITPIGPSTSYDSGQAVAVQPDGKIVVAGYTGFPNADFAVARYNPDGSLDQSFDGDSGNGNGLVVVPIGSGDDEARALAIDTSGRIVVAGLADNGATGVDMGVMRLDSSGRLDSSFGTGGKKLIDISSGKDDEADGVAIQPDGHIFLGGDDTTDFAVVKLDDHGQPDTTFGGGDGIATADLGSTQDIADGMALSGNRLVVVGGSENGGVSDTTTAVLDATTGNLDNSFSADGKDLQNLDPSGSDFANAVAVQPDGKIVVAADVKNDFGVVRYLPDGTLDQSFDGDGGNGNGIVLAPMAAPTQGAGTDGLAIQPNGTLVVVGSVSVGASDTDYGVARLRGTDGTLDTGFSGDGKQITPLTSSFDAAIGVAVQADGKLVVVGRTNQPATGNDIGLVRYLGDPPPVPAPPTPPVKDTTAPKITFSLIRGQKLAKVLKKGLRMRVACSEACALSERITLPRATAKRFKLAKSKKPVVLGRGSRRLAANVKTTVTVKLTAKARRALKRAHPRTLKLTLQLSATDAAGNRGTLKRKLTLRR